MRRRSRRVVLWSVLLLGVTAVVVQVAADIGPLHPIECRLRTRRGYIFELPDEGITLAQFRAEVARSTHGCGVVVVREGSIEDDATVIGGGTGRASLDEAFDREVYVWTTGPGRQAPPPPSTRPSPGG